MQAIDDYINGNLSDAKRRAKQAGPSKVKRALLEEYGYSEQRANIVIGWMFNLTDWQTTCDRLRRLEQYSAAPVA